MKWKHVLWAGNLLGARPAYQSRLIHGRAIANFKARWGQLASNAGPPSGIVEKS